MEPEHKIQQPLASEPAPEPARQDNNVPQSAANTQDAPKKSTLELTILFSAVAFSVFLMAMTGSIIATVSHASAASRCQGYADHSVQAIPKITTHFNSLEDIGWYGSASLVAT